MGGSEAAEASSPWHAGLKAKGRTATFCGAALVTERHVLTAAHCVTKALRKTPHRFRVVLGGHDLSEVSGSGIERDSILLILI